MSSLNNPSDRDSRRDSRFSGVAMTRRRSSRFVWPPPGQRSIQSIRVEFDVARFFRRELR